MRVVFTKPILRRFEILDENDGAEGFIAEVHPLQASYELSEIEGEGTGLSKLTEAGVVLTEPIQNVRLTKVSLKAGSGRVIVYFES